MLKFNLCNEIWISSSIKKTTPLVLPELFHYYRFFWNSKSQLSAVTSGHTLPCLNAHVCISPSPCTVGPCPSLLEDKYQGFLVFVSLTEPSRGPVVGSSIAFSKVEKNHSQGWLIVKKEEENVLLKLKVICLVIFWLLGC